MWWFGVIFNVSGGLGWFSQFQVVWVVLSVTVVFGGFKCLWCFGVVSQIYGSFEWYPVLVAGFGGL